MRLLIPAHRCTETELFAVEQRSAQILRHTGWGEIIIYPVFVPDAILTENVHGKTPLVKASVLQPRIQYPRDRHLHMLHRRFLLD